MRQNVFRVQKTRIKNDYNITMSNVFLEKQNSEHNYSTRRVNFSTLSKDKLFVLLLWVCSYFILTKPQIY